MRRKISTCRFCGEAHTRRSLFCSPTCRNKGSSSVVAFIAKMKKQRKLSDDQVRLVRASTEKDHAIAKTLGVCFSVIHQIRNGRTYRDVV